jgi:putative phosphoesterase
MTRIGLLSDTHGYIHPRCYEFFRDCDEIWHAGDIGNILTADALNEFKPLRAVFGNIDGQQIRAVYKEFIVFAIEEVKVVMIHDGGYPGHYSREARELIERDKPALFISGHSHILKVMYDQKYNCLHMNPGAAGKYGIHRSITMVRFIIDNDKIKELDVLDIKRIKNEE